MSHVDVPVRLARPDAPTTHEPKGASQQKIQKVAAALDTNGFEAIVVDTGDDARDIVLGMIPEGSEVHWGRSKTLVDLGLPDIYLDTTRFDPVRPRYLSMDRRTQGREIRKISSAPDWMLGSVQAVTLDGSLVAASFSGSQLAPYAGGAGRVVLIVGSQKIVPDLDAAIRRTRETVMPYEDAQVREATGRGTQLAKLLVMYAEPNPGRTTVILVREAVGV